MGRALQAPGQGPSTDCTQTGLHPRCAHNHVHQAESPGLAHFVPGLLQGSSAHSCACMSRLSAFPPSACAYRGLAAHSCYCAPVLVLRARMCACQMVRMDCSPGGLIQYLQRGGGDCVRESADMGTGRAANTTLGQHTHTAELIPAPPATGPRYTSHHRTTAAARTHMVSQPPAGGKRCWMWAPSSRVDSSLVAHRQWCVMLLSKL